MRAWSRGADRFLIGIATNLTSMFSSQKIGEWLTFEYLQGDGNQRSMLRIKGFLLQNGGFDVVVDRKAKVLRLFGHPGTIGEWPLMNAPDAMVWVIDALAENVEQQVLDLYDPMKEYLESEDGVSLGARVATLMPIYALLLQIAEGKWDDWFGEYSEGKKSTAKQLLPWRAESFWKLDSERIFENVNEWQSKYWRDLGGVFEKAGFGKGYKVSAWDIGERVGEMMAEDLFEPLKKKGITP